jgi:hypothetical protein
MKLLAIYQYAAPFALFPLSYWLWLQRCEGDHRLVWAALAMPVLFAYLIPGIGTNCLHLWELNTRLRLGKFRPHHGFVFGTATSLFALLLPLPREGVPVLIEAARAGILLCALLGFWNWLYDIHAIRVGFIRVYTPLSLSGAGPEAVTTEYAPVLFGVFGFVYGVFLVANHSLLAAQGRWDLYWWLVGGENLLTLGLPVAAYVLSSWLRHGKTGLEPYRRGNPERPPEIDKERR